MHDVFFSPQPESYFERFGRHLCRLWNVLLSRLYVASWSLEASRQAWWFFFFFLKFSLLKWHCLNISEHFPLDLKSPWKSFWKWNSLPSRLLLWDNVEQEKGGLYLLFNFITFCERQLDKSTDFSLIVSTEYLMTDPMRLQSWIKMATKHNSKMHLFLAIKLHFSVQ